jgi:hypothetical protein
MKYVLTLNMGGQPGSNSHQVIIDHPCETLEEMKKILSSEDFLIVNQFYKEGETRDGEAIWDDKGNMILNTHLIGKIRYYQDTSTDLYRSKFTRNINYGRR